MDRRALPLRQGPIDERQYRSALSQIIAVESTSYLAPSTASADSLNKEFKLHIGRFFYENGLDFDAASSTSFKSMISLFSRRGIQCQAPTVEELNGWIFRDVMREATSRVDEIKRSWAVTGCSILLDGWTYANDRTFVNVLVDSPKGTVYLSSSDITDCVGNMEAMQTFLARVLADVGLHNVVQIVTYSSSAFMMEAGRQLMERYRPIFWTVSASHCIELILENLATMDVIHETLEKAKIISSFVHNHPVALKYVQDQTNGSGLVDSSRMSIMRPFLMVENIVIKKGALKKMFSASHSQSSNLMATVEGRKASEVLADRSFWRGATTILNGAIPVVRLIEWMDNSGRVHMGYIYETIDQAKETIKEGLKKKSEYMPFWDAIDDVWNKCLYGPLHSAGYYFNPNLFYTSDAYVDSEVVTGMSCFLVRSAADFRMQDQMVVQMELYRTGRGGMAAGVPEERRSNLSPAHWWSRYAGECPELQRRVIRLLSQTCDGAARYQLRRSLAETLLTKGGNEDEQKWLRDMVFLRYNMHLQNFVIGSSVSDDAN